MTQLAPGARALIRDEEWLIRRVDPSADGGWLLTCDGTQPGGPRQVTRTFTAPFVRANREEDYRTAWAFFESNTSGAVHGS